MKLKIKIKEKEYEVEIIDNNQGNVSVKIGNNNYTFNSKKCVVINKKFLNNKNNSSQKEIKAPLSGIVSEIFVKEGDIIKNNDKLLILSAMKMENEIISEIEGKIKKIFINKGEKVKEGDMLISYD
jgi:biotin carboxyl carrier protein